MRTFLMKKIKIGNKTVQIEINAKINTGAMSNMLPLSVVKKFKNVPFKETPVWLFAFKGSIIEQAGAGLLGVKHHNFFTSTIFHIVKFERLILLELQTFHLMQNHGNAQKIKLSQCQEQS